jgi:trehalose 6-phosphate phosphatase
VNYRTSGSGVGPSSSRAAYRSRAKRRKVWRSDVHHFRLSFDLTQFRGPGTPALSRRESRLDPLVLPSAFATSLSGAHERVLLLAYDATVAPLQRDQVNACPYQGTPQLLDRIMQSCGTRVALISGRAAHDVRRLLGTSSQAEVWGSHGLERLHPDGRREMQQVQGDILECLEKIAGELGSVGLAPLTENKPGSVSVRWTCLPPHKLEEVKEIAYRTMSSATRNPALKLELLQGGIELRLRFRNKSDAVRTILSEIDRQVPVAYLGHDVSDEDAFRALSERGLSALVSSKSRFSAAQIWLKPPHELITFLQDWVAVCEGEYE